MYPGSCADRSNGGVRSCSTPDAARDQERAHAVHRAIRKPGRHRARQHRPRLRERIDPALVVLRRSERRPVVVVAAAVPLAVPRLHQRVGEAPRLAAVALGSRRRRSLPRRSDAKAVSTGVQEEARARCSRRGRGCRRDSCRRSSRRRPSAAIRAGPRSGPFDRADAVFEEACRPRSRHGGWPYACCSSGSSGRHSRNGTARPGRPRSPVAATYSATDERQPQQIVRASRSQSLAAGLVPPVLDVAFAELTAGGAQDVLAREVRARPSSAMTSCS